MQTRNIKLNNQRLLFVGPIYNKTNKLQLLEEICKSNDIFIFIGDISYPYKSANDITKRINELQGYMEGKKYFYILGNEDIDFMKEIYISNADTYDWFNQQCIAIKFNYPNNYNILALHGGIAAKHKTMNDLNIDLDFSFENGIPDPKKNWHKTYDGRFGYIVSSHPANKNNKIGIYAHSMSLDTNCDESDILIIQEINDKGIGKTFYI